MTDYHPLIARAVEGLQKSTGEARRALYERARTALVTQLRSVDPPLSETEITKERLALEDAIRKVEAETARKARTELRETRVATAPARRVEPASPRPAAAPTKSEAQRRAYLPPSARERLLSARAASLTREGIRGFRDAVGGGHGDAGTGGELDSEQDTRDSYGVAAASARIAESSDAMPERDYTQQLDHLNSNAEHLERLDGRESGFEFERHHPSGHSARYLPSPTFEHEPEQTRPPRSYRGIARLVLALVIFAGVAALVTWQWSNLTGLYHRGAQIGTKPRSQSTAAPPAAEPKFSGRVPQEGAQAPAAGAAPSGQTPPAVAQRVVLYEEDPNDPAGKRYAGSAIWRTETVSPGSGLAPELAVRADIEIPERRMTVTWSLRRNTDQALPASHTIEVMFNLPADFAGGGIANVPGILMKQSEQARGTPLAGLAVKVTNGFFLIGLSAVEADMQRNVQLLKDRPWFDIPIVYTNGGRAILAMEKGPPGDRAFAEAFAAWEKK